MLKNIKWLVCFLLLPLFAACSWEDLPAYEEAEITGVQFYYRWASSTDKDPITGEPVVKEKSLDVKATRDADAGTINVEITLPGTNSTFTQAVRDGVTVNNLVGQVTLSTAARLSVADGHKVLGVPDDWSTPHTFVVMAANGEKKNWTITVTGLNK
ncbi:MAG: hypothetical protein NC336_08480 [Clostridium sp.]|nr:hypothetical protein [Clostridium sp.]